MSKKLANDCFALPQGVEWTPVDTALQRLRERLDCVVGSAQVLSEDALGRVLAQQPLAARSNPPYANSAVDGYGFAATCLQGDGEITLPLVEGRAAAGAPFAGAVPAGHAVRILTGAMLPEGVDTVVLQEDTDIADGMVRFPTGLKPHSNARKAGEDVRVGEPVLAIGHRVNAADIALLTALGCDTVTVFIPLKVGVLSTGDELARGDGTPEPHEIFDANRPMLKALIDGWGMEVVDLGQATDDAKDVQNRLSDAANQCDAILTTGGASAGDEDYISAALKAHGALSTWRIAVKPGRPLALGMWDGTPVFGLPGNPVAAFVCALIFARPALCLMSGRGWLEPASYQLGAEFSKVKKPGRREFLRARRTKNGVEAFKSEGSGRISGISWADGLIELPDEGMVIKPGDTVRYLPYSSFDL